jgi:signal transduction histidine kinase
MGTVSPARGNRCASTRWHTVVVPRLLRPLTSAVTYTRWLHLCIPLAVVAIWLFIDQREPYLVAVLIFPVGLIPSVRTAEALQAQLLLTPDKRGSAERTLAATPAATWADRWRTVAWLELRLLLAGATLVVTIWLPMLTVDLACLAVGRRAGNFLRDAKPHWWFGPLVPLCMLVVIVGIVALGHLVTTLAQPLLGPSPAQRLAALEDQNQQLLERTRIARDLHDSIGHALTIAVMQAGAARAANDPAFTHRALHAIEDTGRTALEDLDRVLQVLRDSAASASQRPTLTQAGQLFDSARACGARIDVDLSAELEQIPPGVSQEGYRILQEALTNSLRHAGPVPIHVRIAVTDRQLDMEVTNPVTGLKILHHTGAAGLHGIRERAALLGGHAVTGRQGGNWTVSARLPLQHNRR